MPINQTSCPAFQMLRDRFKEFARDTETIGQERVAAVNEICDQLIGAGHSDAATIAEWKDQINEAWADLLELIDTRTQMLAASWELHRFFHDCKETLDRIYVSGNIELSLRARNLKFMNDIVVFYICTILSIRIACVFLLYFSQTFLDSEIFFWTTKWYSVNGLYQILIQDLAFT